MDRRPIPVTSLVLCAPFGEVAEQVEGAPLLREYGPNKSIEGSNPSLSANRIKRGTRLRVPLFIPFAERAVWTNPPVRQKCRTALLDAGFAGAPKGRGP
jgi:hypothetical protein